MGLAPFTRPTAAVLVAALLLGCDGAPRETPVPLPDVGAAIDQTSVSGISSGAYMAGQFEFAHAKIVKGTAIIAGGPYGCSESIFAGAMPAPGAAWLNLSKAVNGCMLDMLGAWGVANPADLAEKARARAEKGEIDPIADVVTDKIYLFSGKEDRTVAPSIVTAASEFYTALGAPAANIKLVTTYPAGHAFVTDNAGGACEISQKPYVVDCDYDQAGDLLAHIYGALKPRSASPAGDFIVFDQKPFKPAAELDGLADRGVVYVPHACRTKTGCRIHVAYHGCGQNRQAIGDVFISESGFARWADSNSLIILYPQVATTPLNPQGCWDWWGYTGSDYLARTAPQIAAVYAMLQRLSGAAPPS
ncbi:MAG: extracellular catalytic domain type 2 short-chain-length polyhydroxyalkanoate depolymerase [Hyphomicrobium sp.]